MNRLARLRVEDIQAWIGEVHLLDRKGQTPYYIPVLNRVNPEVFALQIHCFEGEILSWGDETVTFPLMSVIKPFLLLYLLNHLGEDAVFRRVGKQASSYPFNSLTQLQEDSGFPRNPLINSGAIALADLLGGETPESRCENLLLWLNKMGNCQLFLDRSVLESVHSYPNVHNQALSLELEKNGYISHRYLALETYNRICCLSGKIADLANLGKLILAAPFGEIILEIMTNCGLYEASEKFAIEVGFPTKSGVSGALLSILSDEGVIACYSPLLNEQGNSVLGLDLLTKLSNFFKEI
ncbi:MAG: glutaminase A [Microcystis aeruginosa Ma_MB_F_20061100_S19]|uniref:glutaminase n=1 Tax=Microcystis aeruginosa SPC777 TaxID=482300 RepID=S3JPY9_MICAE|nr:glutaminase [Microcystis aeruginosa]NCR98934.1 glutaminase A [Microcystis aeruginosa L311-01]OCY12957.1 MAG: glutaminase A [Microcystis aeruginosa CACIAM 03]TRU09332.1 MAG: glutaminase A [Microcystis aeruginosa Ma_MB_F_20061100_S19D]TRU12379.1 MAG: glutaminase A [Microcystis aeruginosa Ma_MB_F_20061100_S19]EPF21982.1 Glutaminase [Microcystis aeruginosa SPC777]